MLSKRTRKLLKWMRDHSDESHYFRQIQQAVDPREEFLYVSFLQSLCKEGYISCFMLPSDIIQINDEKEDIDYQYRITETGLAVLESHISHLFSELRAWTTLVIALAAFAKSFFF